MTSTLAHWTSTKTWRHVLHRRVTRHLGHGVRLGADVWDREYDGGDWAYMAGAAEAPRDAQLLELVGRHGDGSSLLDVGCGDGVLWQRLRDADLAPARDLGIDISPVAVSLAAAASDERAEFRVVDFDLEAVGERFGLVVLNEVLAYFRRPSRTLHRALDHNLAPGGAAVVSLWDEPAYGGDDLWRRLLDGVTVVDELTRTNDAGLRWHAKVVRP